MHKHNKTNIAVFSLVSLHKLSFVGYIENTS